VPIAVKILFMLATSIEQRIDGISYKERVMNDLNQEMVCVDCKWKGRLSSCHSEDFIHDNCPKCSSHVEKLTHGLNCEKKEHTGSGYLHHESDDLKYNVDGCWYCGRCHYGL